MQSGIRNLAPPRAGLMFFVGSLSPAAAQQAMRVVTLEEAVELALDNDPVAVAAAFGGSLGGD